MKKFKEKVQDLVDTHFKIWPRSVEEIKEEIEENDDIDEAELNKIIKDCMDNFATVNTENIDFNSLDDAFNALIQKGIFCVHNVQTTPSSCWEAVKEKLNEYKQKKKTAPATVYFDPESIWAVAFYHFQDTERAAQGMPLTISYIAVADGDQERIDSIKANFLIMGMLKQFGLKIVDPSFDTETKIFLDINWLAPLNRVSNMEQNRGIAVEYVKNPMLDIPLSKYKKMVEDGAANLINSSNFCVHENYYVDQLLDLAVDDREGAIDKKVFILEKLKERVEIKSKVFSKLSGRNMQELRGMAITNNFFPLMVKFPKEIKDMITSFKNYESTKQAIELLERLFNVTLPVEYQDASQNNSSNKSGATTFFYQTVSEKKAELASKEKRSAFQEEESSRSSSSEDPPSKKRSTTPPNRRSPSPY